MLLPKPKDALHRAWLLRILSAIYEDTQLANSLVFKGGTCAALRGLLDRFSVDLDFDCTCEQKELPGVRKKMEKIFFELGLEIKDQSKQVPQYFLKYPAKASERNTLKIDVTYPPIKASTFEMVRLLEIAKIAKCQTVETMFANKLVALIDRFEKSGSIAGRDVYDIHHFFLQGFRYNEKVILERRKMTVEKFFQELIAFVEKQVTVTIIDQDLNMLLENSQFQKIRKHLKSETLMFLKNELENLK
ncbi:MAG: nucleotidyl transferase AbiEii/AbiGii toxin family protein [Candidatus Moraniibacteriota bacterium]